MKAQENPSSETKARLYSRASEVQFISFNHIRTRYPIPNTPRGPRTRASEYTHKGKEKRNKLTVHFCKLLNIQFTLSLQLA